MGTSQAYGNLAQDPIQQKSRACYCPASTIYVNQTVPLNNVSGIVNQRTAYLPISVQVPLMGPHAPLLQVVVTFPV
jgi:hypothetical protein